MKIEHGKCSACGYRSWGNVCLRCYWSESMCLCRIKDRYEEDHTYQQEYNPE